MSNQQSVGRDERFLRRYEYPDRWVVAADLPAGAERVDVDVVGRTAILVADDGDRVAETEFDLPADGGEAAINNGVLTITIEK